MSNNNQFGDLNLAYILGLYDDYLTDPESVGEDLVIFFNSNEFKNLIQSSESNILNQNKSNIQETNNKEYENNLVLDDLRKQAELIKIQAESSDAFLKGQAKLIQDQLKLFKDCNAPCMVFAEVSGSIQGDPDRKLSTRPQMDLDESKRYYEKISEMGKYLEDEDMPLAYHHHMGTIIETEEDTIRLLENTHDSVKLTLDTGHMLFAQGDSLKILNDFSERLIHMHCKDIRKSVLEKSLKEDLSFRGAFLEGAFTVPGDGCIDYKPLFDVLKEKNYSGWLVVEAEQDPAKANPFEYAKIGYKYLTETLNNSNIDIYNN